MKTAQNTPAPTYEELQKLKEAGKARIIETALEGTCQLVEVDGQDNVVVLADNSTIFHNEDLKQDTVFPTG